MGKDIYSQTLYDWEDDILEPLLSDEHIKLLTLKESREFLIKSWPFKVCFPRIIRRMPKYIYDRYDFTNTDPKNDNFFLPDDNLIYLKKDSSTKMIIVHEMCHAIVHIDYNLPVELSHCPIYTRVLMEQYSKVFNLDINELRSSAVKHGVIL